MSEEPTIGLRIKEVLATYLKRDPATIKSEHTLRDDLGLDSLMTFELLYDLENAFDLEIPNEDLPGLTTIGEVTAYIEARVNPKHASIPDKKRTIPQHPKSQPSLTKAQKGRTTGPTKSKTSATPAKGRTATRQAKSKTTLPKAQKRLTTKKTKTV